MTQNKDTSDNNAHKRKDAHLDLAKSDLAQTAISHPFDEVNLTHHALPDRALSDIDLSVPFLSKTCALPFFIGAMTGGTDRADAINSALAEVAQSHNIALALGSQRASLATGRDQSYLRKYAPDTLIIGNLGITQLARPDGADMALRAIDAVEADAMAIHLNPLQEIAQPEGDHDWTGTANALENFIRQSPVPVIVKEVGAGINDTLARQLIGMGAASVDIAGLGGTNWTRIEQERNALASRQEVLRPFLDWGIDTKTALQAARQAAPMAHIIASGGIRHGLDVAKALALGADMACAAGPFLKALEAPDGTISQDALHQEIDKWAAQIRIACFLTNAAGPAALKGRIQSFG